ncbi:MAG: hypothetical protein LBU03_02360 [Tannerellaceae bacterium]|nr:hypothetical protein [Tannerellaceae bacterium]
MGSDIDAVIGAIVDGSVYSNCVRNGGGRAMKILSVSLVFYGVLLMLSLGFLKWLHTKRGREWLRGQK